MRAPLPKGFVILAWNAMVGQVAERIATHFCCKRKTSFFFYMVEVIKPIIAQKKGGVKGIFFHISPLTHML